MGSFVSEEWMLFEIHMKMAFRLAQVYGWDLTNSAILLHVIDEVINHGMMVNTAEIAITNIGLMLAVRWFFDHTALGHRLGGEVAQQVAAELGARAAADATERIARTASGTAIARETWKEGLLGVGKMAAVWATRGLAILVSGGLDVGATILLAWRIDKAGKAWLAEFLHLGETLFRNVTARRAAFRVFARMMLTTQQGARNTALNDKGVFADRELALYAAFLANHYYYGDRVGDRRWIGDEEQQEHARNLKKSLADLDAGTDIADMAWWPDQHRITFLTMLYALMYVDDYASPEEVAYYNSVRMALELGPPSALTESNAMMLDGPLIDQIQLGIEAEVTLQRPDRAAAFGLPTDNLIPALTMPAANDPEQEERDRRTHLLATQKLLTDLFAAAPAAPTPPAQ